MADKDKAGAKGGDDPDYGMLPPKALERLFGTDIILRNPDEPSDGTFDVIKDKKGVVLCIRSPRSGRWLRFNKTSAQRLVDEAQTLLPVLIEPRVIGRKRKSVDYGEQEAQAVKVNRVQQKKDAKKNWRVSGRAVRFSLRVREQTQTSHTGCSLDFDALEI